MILLHALNIGTPHEAEGQVHRYKNEESLGEGSSHKSEGVEEA